MYPRILFFTINPSDKDRTRAVVTIARAAIADLDFQNLTALRIPGTLLDDEAIENRQITQRITYLRTHLLDFPSLRWHEYEVMRLLCSTYQAFRPEDIRATCAFVAHASLFSAHAKGISLIAFSNWACAVIAAVHEGREVPPAPMQTSPFGIP